jgi:hypothetical protein
MNTVYVVNDPSNFRPAGVAGAELSVSNAVVEPDAGDIAVWSAAQARVVELSVKGDVRYTLDGTDPVASGAGSVLASGVYYWHLDKVRAAKFIRSAGSDAVVRFEPGVF